VADQDPSQRQDTDVIPTDPATGATAAAAQPASDEPSRRRDLDPLALITGLLFIALAVLLMSGVDVSVDWFGHGIAWILLIGAGIGLLVNELRRARHRR
jgi:fatty acid desaturase